ncbi:MAG TPA: MarR family transcriptional regulator [Thermomicrobiales bacterium]|nr:MarR family transcriptional regulator [Thermomicrobiales bacterium]
MDTWFLFLQAQTRIVDQLTADLERARHLPLSWYDVLVQLNQTNGKRLLLQELGCTLALSASGLSRRVARMEEAGLVRREPCANDKRGVIVALTERGEDELRCAAPIHLHGVKERFTRHLTDEENDAMYHALCKILAHSSAGTHDPD